MSTAKSSMMMAVLALFLCLSSTVAAADLYSPGNPLNCTAWIANCQTLTTSVYGGGKNSSYTGPSAQCNVTNLSSAQPLCGENVICLATFLVQTDNSTVSATTTAATIAGTTTTVSATTSASASSATSATSATAAATTTTSSSSLSSVYTVVSVDLTSQLLALYDTSKCGTSAAVAQAATSLGALVAVASIVSFMSNML
ncbi:hypothetical protein EDD21DRAFT_349532 [Dissophora ornata]|nr:hypothetical protein BGZ58_002546 [Dissophora ornata]KAI8605932.1 hypothetical protein EDD21DRAFT_349532 [Dissophora ornata]